MLAAWAPPFYNKKYVLVITNKQESIPEWRWYKTKSHKNIINEANVYLQLSAELEGVEGKAAATAAIAAAWREAKNWKSANPLKV